MNFLEALKIVQEDPTKMAVPVADQHIGLVFVRNERPCWQWSQGISARIPAPLLLFGEWRVVNRLP
jgi:hypothetical protein